MYLDYEFSSGGDGLSVKTADIEQCSKDANPDCAKGDGRVTLLVGNRDEDKNLVENEKTGNTYVFRITDTAIEPDFEKQAEKLANLLNNAAF